jgi:hypothetical protein
MGKPKVHNLYVAIDPGINGAIAALYPDGKCDVHSVPTVMVGDKRSFDPMSMAKLIKGYGSGAKICLEAVHAMPGNGAVSMFFFGRGFGIWEGVLGALGRTYELVPPQAWKKHYPELMSVKGDKRPRSKIKAEAKKKALILARTLFPKVADKLKREKDDGRAEALLMAMFCASRDGVVIPPLLSRGHNVSVQK